MTSGKPAIRCRARAKSIRAQCGNAPIRGATVCRSHGANRAVRAAARRRTAEQELRRGLVRWERERPDATEIRAALGPWADEEAVTSSIARRWGEPVVLRRTASEMHAVARELIVEAPAVDAEPHSRRELFERESHQPAQDDHQ